MNTPQTAFAFIHNRVFGADALFIRTKKHGWRAQRAMVARPHGLT
ncbi:MAG TPA: hypothetical protein VIJ43_10735 [Burkholderiales bacterium]